MVALHGKMPRGAFNILKYSRAVSGAMLLSLVWPLA